MQHSPMRSLAFVSLLFCAASCHKHIYLNKQEVKHTPSFTAKDFRPVFEKGLYRCEVNGRFSVKKFHLSGILYLKTLEDKSTRVIFQSEMGATLFDFGWNANDSFQVYSIIDQMNKAPLIKTLRKDFELILAKHIHTPANGSYNFNNNADLLYTKFNLVKGFVYYVTNSKNELVSIENADDKKKVIQMDPASGTVLKTLPETLTIKHLRANFTINLKKIIPENAEE
jgi:hypothetical protein